MIAQKTNAIVLSNLKYGDSSLIVKCFTEEFGFKSYLLKGILSEKKGRLKPAYFQPFTQIEVIANHRSEANLNYIKEVKVNYAYQTLHIDLKKSAVVYFLSEICTHTCQIEHPEPKLYQFLSQSLAFFDKQPFLVNFHLKFLIELTSFLGFNPEKPASNIDVFNIEEGTFSFHKNPDLSIEGEHVVFFVKLLKTTIEEIHTIKENRCTRNQLTQNILTYYQWHVPGFKKIKSLEVLQSLF